MGENGALWGGECLRVNYRESSTWAACLRWRLLVAILPQSAVAKPADAVLAFCAGVAELSETVSVQQQNWSVLARAIERESMHHWRHRVGGCSMP